LFLGDFAFVYAHEALHAIYDHLSRRKAYPKLWNIVCDAFINEYLHRYLKWHEGTTHGDRLDYVLKEGVRWEPYPDGKGGLPKAVRDAYPVERMNEFTADQIYMACLEDMKNKGVDPKVFQMGRIRRKKADPNQPPAGKPIRQTVAVKVGDLVRVKSKDKVGRIKSMSKDSQGRIIKVQVEVVPDDEVKKLGLRGKPTDKTPVSRGPSNG
jgi:hypothetical protein